MITEIAFTIYPVTDLAKSRAFYEGLLGLKPTMTTDFWVEYTLGENTFAISTYGTPSPVGASIAFEVDDFAAEVERLKQAGVALQMEPMDTPVCHLVTMKDPDGNSFIIHRRKEGLAS